jgi:hypothetical protein
MNDKIKPSLWLLIFWLYGISIIFITAVLGFILPIYGYNFCLTYGIDAPNLSILALETGFNVVYGAIVIFLFYIIFYYFTSMKKESGKNRS